MTIKTQGAGLLAAHEQDWAAASPDALIVLRRDGTVLHWNAGAQAIYGHSAAEACGRCVADLLVPADQREAHLEGLARSFERAGQTAEAVRVRRDGSLLYVDVTTRRTTAADGTEVLLSAEKDVTLIKVARDARLMEARFRDLLESTPDGIVMANPTGHIVIANSQAERLFGYGPGELRGCTIDSLLPQRYRQAHVGHRSNYFLQPRKRAMGSGLDLWGLRRDGTEFPIEISLSPLRTEESAFVLSAIRDISERKQIERTLQEKNAELARANEAKDRFLASMSHELRTPLNAIIGFTGTLLMRLPGPLNDEQEQQLRTVQKSGRHLLALINDLLDVARITAGKTELQPAIVDLAAAAAEAVKTLTPQAQARGLRLAFAAPDATVQARTDPRLLSQILLNLVGNAVKFTDTGGIDVAVRAEADHLVIAVRDTGVGISEADQARLFAPFSRVRHGGGQDKEGTGLGLHLSQQLAQLLGGRIVLHSVLGEGSTFELWLPAEGPVDGTA